MQWQHTTFHKIYKNQLKQQVYIPAPLSNIYCYSSNELSIRGEGEEGGIDQYTSGKENGRRKAKSQEEG